MLGAGTTLIEAKLLDRNAIGVDINPIAVEQTEDNLKFDSDGKTQQKCHVGDIRNLKNIDDCSIDLIVTHPPHLNIIKYSDGKIVEDLSNIGSIKKFLVEFELTVKELYRVLKPDRYCAILIGDTRRKRHFVPIAYNVMTCFLKNGFFLKEDIIKVQHNCQTTPKWRAMVGKYDFYLIMHEHLFVFRKPALDENASDYRENAILWNCYE